MTSTSPWEEFKVGKPSEQPNWTNTNCQPLTAVSHVAHLPIAYRIVEDQRLRADLIFDKSILNTHRARVVWLSPNDWTGAGGYRYGNVSFEFPWAKVLEGRRFFWVESIAYGVKAYRILFTTTDWSGVLLPYDPARGDGPWWVDGDGNHYWNGDHCFEVMFEDDLSLDFSTGLSFVDHHDRRCSIDAYGCSYRGMRANRAGAEFLATLLSRYVTLSLPPITYTMSDGSQTIAGRVETALVDLVRACTRLAVPGPGITAGEPQAYALARSLVGTLYREPSADRDNLASLFSCSKCLVDAVVEVMASGFTGPEAGLVRQALAEWRE